MIMPECNTLYSQWFWSSFILLMSLWNESFKLSFFGNSSLEVTLKYTHAKPNGNKHHSRWQRIRIQEVLQQPIGSTCRSGTSDWIWVTSYSWNLCFGRNAEIDSSYTFCIRAIISRKILLDTCWTAAHDHWSSCTLTLGAQRAKYRREAGRHLKAVLKRQKRPNDENNITILHIYLLLCIKFWSTLILQVPSPPAALGLLQHCWSCLCWRMNERYLAFHCLPSA